MQKKNLFDKLEKNLELQLFVACEEAGELIQAVSKVRRNFTRQSLLDLASEIADVRIMCEQLEYFFGLEQWAKDEYDYKLARLADRLKGDEDDNKSSDSELRGDQRV